MRRGVASCGHIYLAGFMGCGKSTVGSALASRLRWRFVDLDRSIEEQIGLAIPLIFQEYGEAYFRRLESEALHLVAEQRAPAVVALGGGAFASAKNRSLISRSGVSVWLDVPFGLLAARIALDGGRPLARSPEELYRLYRVRLRAYRRADLRVRVANAPAEQVARAIVRRLRHRDFGF